MDDRQRLIHLLASGFASFFVVTVAEDNKIHRIKFCADDFADYLIRNGVTIKPVVPGPSENNINISELCFRNGEEYFREKILAKLMEMQTHVHGAQHAQLVAVTKIIREISL